MDSESTPINVLCFDGGDMSFSSLLILKAIIQSMGAGSEDSIKPSQLFDLICGTAAGGVIALMLGRLEMTIDETIDAYQKVASNVMGRKNTSFSNLQALINRPINRPKYDASLFERELLELKGDVNTPLGSDKGCRTFVAATVPDSKASELLRTYPPVYNCAVWEAARATTAAPLYFDRMKMSDGRQLIDGGSSGASNPSLLAWEEVQRVFDGRDIACFLSIGDGTPTFIPQSSTGLAEALLTRYRDCEHVEEEVQKKFPQKSSNYFRFSVTSLEKYSIQKDLAQATTQVRAYLESYGAQEQIARCAAILKHRLRLCQRKA